MCDVPDFCAEGTEDDLAWLDNLGNDCLDWARHPSWCVDEMFPPSRYANATGVDATEVCCVCGGSSTGRFSSDAGGGYADSCAFANDGMCDEPDYCLFGTDTTDCDANPSEYSYGYGSYNSGYGFNGYWYSSNGGFGGDNKGPSGCPVQNLLIFKCATPLSLMHACKY